MNAIQKHWQNLIIIVALGIGVGIALAQSATALTVPLVLSDAKILYLAPSSLSPSDDTPGSFAALQAEGVTVLHEINDLKRSVEQSKPDAIIIHQSSLSSIDRSWVASQYHSGIIIAIINMKMRDMADLVGDSRILESPWTDNWYKKPFYSYVGVKLTLLPSGEPLRERVVRGTNNINDQEGNLKRFLYTLKLAIKAFESQP